MITVSSCGRTDVGRVRTRNEDSFLCLDELGFYAVADGVGGHAAGEVASRLAVDTAATFIRGRRNSEDLDASVAARNAVEAACQAVYEQGRATPRLRGMLTTLTIVLVDGDTATMAHVGDSRLYLIRDGRVERLSTDHTLADELARSGIIRFDEVADNPFARVLTRSIGEKPSVIVDTLTFGLVAGDVLVLTTDGANAVMDDAGAVLEMIEADVESVADQVVKAANERGGRDNSTVVVLRPEGITVSSRSAVEFLRASEPFSRLSTVGVLSVAAAGTVEDLAKGAVVFREGDVTDDMVVVLQGELTWTVGDETRQLRSGECMGISGLFHPTRSPGTLRAHARAQVLRLNSDQLGRLMRRRARLGAAVARSLASSMAKTFHDTSPRARGF